MLSLQKHTMSHRIALSAFLIVLSANAAIAVEEPPSVAPVISAEEPPNVTQAVDVDTESLVDDLGDDSYAVRTQAAEKLESLGAEVSREALTAGLKSDDPQIRRSCRDILRDVMFRSHQRRIDAFIADVEGKHDHDLPGWKQFRELAGNDKKSRELFVTMQKTEPGLLASVEAGEGAVIDAVRLRLMQITQRMSNPNVKERRQPELGTVAALMLVSSYEEFKLPADITNNSAWYNTLRNAEFKKKIANEDETAIRALVNQWVMRSVSGNMIYQKLTLAVELKLKSGLDLALVELYAKTLQTSYKPYAFTAVGKIGGKSFMPVFAEMLTDEGVCSRRTVVKNGKGVVMNIEVRDAALAWLIHLTDQKHEDYLLPQAKKAFDRLKGNVTYLSPSYLAFQSKEDRTKALAKWKEWVKDNPLPEMPEQAIKAKELAKTRSKDKPAQAAGRVAVPRMIAWGQADPDAEDEDPLAYADRTLVRQLSRARRLIGEDRYADATLFLGEVLAAENDVLYRPNRWLPLARALKPEAERLVASLPKDGLETYSIRFNRPAKLELQSALDSGDRDALAMVGGRFFHTQSGARAVYLLASDHLAQSRPLQAMLAFEKLKQRSAFAREFEPSLSIKLAASQLQLGMRHETEQTLVALQSSMPKATIVLGGVEHRLFTTPGEAIPWFEELIGAAPQTANLEDWLVPRGNTAGNKTADSIIPWLTGKKITAAANNAHVDGLIRKLMNARIEEHRAILPSMHPLVVDDTVLLRTPTRLKAVSLATTELLWEAPTEDALRDVVERSTAEEIKKRSDAIERGLARRLWSNGTFGSISSDGSRVFCIEDLSFGAGPDYRRLIVTADGKQRLDPGWQKSHNLLAAYDIKTGKLVWEVGGPKDAAGVKLDNIFFLGPPTLIADRLFVIGEIGRQTKLYQLNAETGEMNWSLTLEHRENQKSIQFSPYLPIWLLEPESHRCGAIGSSDGGIMVCPVSQNRFVAVNLATRSILWTYQPDDLGMAITTSNWQQTLVEASEREQTERWADASPTLVDDRTLITPMDSGKMLCVRSDDGVLLWQAPRGDGFYVGGVDNGVIVVVGLSSVSGLNLATGESLWKTEFPDGAVTSGRGYLADGKYYTPVNTGEVIVVNTSGRIVARSHSPDGLPPGNLLAIDGAVVSQGVDSVWRFDSAEQHENQLLAKLKTDPKNAQLTAELGRAQLYQGRVGEAIATLQQSLELRSDPVVREVLYDAVVEGLRIDFPKYISIAKEMALTAGDADANRLRQLAHAYSHAGQLDLAFDAWLRVFEQEKEADSLDYLSASWRVRRDRQMLARLDDLLSHADEKQLPDLRNEILKTIGGRNPQMALQLLAAGSEAHQLRVDQFEILKKAGKAIEAGQMLRPGLTATAPENALATHAMLAEWLQATGSHGEGLELCKELRGRYAETVVLNGKTGRELYEQIAAADSLRQRIEKPYQWPTFTKKESKNGSTGSQYQIDVEVIYVNSPLGATPFELKVDNSGRNLFFLDSLGNQKWTLTLPNSKTNWRYGGGVFTYCKAIVSGRLVVLWAGNRVIAIDTSGADPKVLWTQDTLHANPMYPNVPKMPPAQFRSYRMSDKPLASDLATIAACSHAIFFQREDELLAIEPVTGKILWSRSNLPTFADLAADESYVYFTPTGTEEAIRFSTFDGREVGRIALPPHGDRLVKRNGSATYTTIDQAGQRWLETVRLETAETLWKQPIEADAAIRPIGSHEICVVQPQAGFSVYSAATGEVLMNDPQPAPGGLRGLFAWETETGWIFAVQTPEVDDDGDTVVMNQFYLGPMFNGRLYAFDRAGKELWNRDTPKHGCAKYQPINSPVLALGSQLRVRNGKSYKTKYKVTCIDKRTGDVLHEEVSDGSLSRLQLVATPEDNKVILKTSRSTITLLFGVQDEAKDKPKGDAKDDAKKAVEEAAAKAVKEEDAKKQQTINAVKGFIRGPIIRNAR